MALISQPPFSINGVSSSSCKTSIFFTTSKSKISRNLKLLASSSDSNNDSSKPKPSDNNNISSTGKKEIPLAVKLAMEKAKKYKKTKTIDDSTSSSNVVAAKEESSGLGDNSGDDDVEEKMSKKVARIPSIDFVGLSFSDKKQTRGLPAGLVPTVDSYSGSDLPEVEFIVGDSSKFAPAKELNPELNEEEQDDSDVYKPTVSTWGVFPRPSNISKTYGGGKVIQPGGIQEASGDKVAKDARTKKLVANYKSMAGLVVDPKLKAECEKTLKEGEALMDRGKLQQALPFFEKVMKEMSFQNEVHGLAALQWSICQDSLNRSAEARVMYEKLQSHPTVEVRKKAKQLNFGFEAMEMIKFKSTSQPIKTGYRNFFDAFVEDKTGYSLKVADEEEDNDAVRQTIPYVIFLIAPLLIVFILALRKAGSF